MPRSAIARAGLGTRVSCLLALATAAFGACGPTTTVDPAADPQAVAGHNVHVEPLTIFVPAGWLLTESHIAFSGGGIVGYLSDRPLDPACGTPPDPNCLAGRPLAEGSFRTTIGYGAMRGGTVFELLSEGDWHRRVDSMPARETLHEPIADVAADLHLTWTMLNPGSVNSFYTINVVAREPDTGAVRDDLARVVSTIRYDDHPPPLPAGDEAKAILADVVRRTINELDRSSREAYGTDYYACFPRGPGMEREASITGGPGGPLRAPLEVRCSVVVVPADPLPLWELRLKATWRDIGGAPSAEYAEAIYLDADGTFVYQAILTPDVSFPTP